MISPRQNPKLHRGADSGALRRQMTWITAAVVLPIAGGALTYSWVSNTSTTIPLVATFDRGPPMTPLIKIAEPVKQPIGEIVEFVVGRNDTLERIFRQSQLNLDDLATIRALPGMRGTLDILKPGELITLIHVDGMLQKLTRRMSDTELLSVNRHSDGFAAQVVETPLQFQTASAHGTIDSSLFNAARAAGMGSELIMTMANDVFGWDIDFALEIQPGDSFSAVYQKKYRDGKYLGDGQILAAEFINQGHSYRAVYFQSADGKITDYFTPDGKSMRKQFLRAPVEFKYISSNFNPHRRHPILNIVRAHQGVDYAAPTGTPVRASGDGRVSLAGTKGGYGNAIVLEHGGGISSLYGHLSRFAKDIRAGARVKQGDVIGYVGTSGMSTAPHLHYEYLVNGVHKNPRTVALPDAEPIGPAYLQEFQSQTNAALTQLDRTKITQVASVSPDRRFSR